jgi:hypothetical protein
MVYSLMKYKSLTQILFCTFAHSCTQHILYCVLALFFFVLYTLYCQFLWIVLCFSSSCIPYIASFSGLSFAFLRLVYPILPVSLDCPLLFFVLYTLYCQFLWIVLCFSSSCIPYIASFSGLAFAFLRLVYPILPVSLDCPLLFFVLCTLYCQFLWIVHFFIAPLVFSNVYLQWFTSCL